MKNTIKALAITALVAVIGFSLAGCGEDPDTGGGGGGGGGSKPQLVTRDFKIQMWGKDIIVTDTRNGATDKNLSELKVIDKLEGAIVELDAVKSEPASKSAFDKVLENGMIIIIEKPSTPYNGFRTKADGKTIMFDIDYISKTATTKDDIANDFYDAVMDYLSKNLAKE